MGQAAGITGYFLKYLYVYFETSFDFFNVIADRIYKLSTDIKRPPALLTWSSTAAPVAINKQLDFPGLESAVRISDLGLSSYNTIQRTNEIGVRKVLSASLSNIVNLLSINFLKLLFMAFIIALPVAWFFMNKWLTDFADLTGLSWWMFVFTGIVTVIIAFNIISSQAIKAAVANTVKSLRSE